MHQSWMVTKILDAKHQMNHATDGDGLGSVLFEFPFELNESWMSFIASSSGYIGNVEVIDSRQMPERDAMLPLKRGNLTL